MRPKNHSQWQAEQAPVMDEPQFRTVESNFDGDVHIRANMHDNPVTMAVFDGNERISEWVAGLQKESLHWFAEGYVRGSDE